MKKLFLLTALAVFGMMNVNAQDENGGQTSKGKWLVEANTGFGTGHGADTGFRLTAFDGVTVWNVGLEGGYFVADDLAIKAGLGYGDSDLTDGVFSFKAGAKYYIDSKFPVQLDLKRCFN